jgi:hypothetical protein
VEVVKPYDCGILFFFSESFSLSACDAALFLNASERCERKNLRYVLWWAVKSKFPIDLAEWCPSPAMHRTLLDICREAAAEVIRSISSGFGGLMSLSLEVSSITASAVI